MKLFRVHVEVDVFVLAESEAEAEEDAGMHAGEELEGSSGFAATSIGAQEITRIDQVPKDHQDSHPYGENPDDLTIRKFLALPPPEPEPVRDTWTQPLFPEPAPAAAPPPSTTPTEQDRKD